MQTLNGANDSGEAFDKMELFGKVTTAVVSFLVEMFAEKFMVVFETITKLLKNLIIAFPWK